MKKLGVILWAVTFFMPAILHAENVTSFNLDNGMQVVVIEDHRAPIVTHMVWYKVGSGDEVAGKSGIAHFLEHLMFKGTKTYPAGAFSAIVAANGGQENAFTSYDYTGYYQTVSADRLELVMKLESDRMQNLTLSQKDVLPERQVIIEERNMRVENSPSALLREQRSALQFYNSRYGVPTIGWRHEMEHLTRQDALNFYKKYYAPNNAILIVAGDTTPDDVRRLAEKYYGKRVPSKNIPPRSRPQEPRHLGPVHIDRHDDRVRQSQVERTYSSEHRKPGDQKEAAALETLAELLGGSGLTSYLGQELQLKQNVALNVAAFYNGGSLDKNIFGLYVVPAPGVTPAKAEAALNAALKSFLAKGVDEDHLARLKIQAKADEIYARDSLSGLAQKYGQALASGLTVKDVQAWPDLLQAVTAKDVMAAAHKVLNMNYSVTSWLLPKAEG